MIKQRLDWSIVGAATTVCVCVCACSMMAVRWLAEEVARTSPFCHVSSSAQKLKEDGGTFHQEATCR